MTVEQRLQLQREGQLLWRMVEQRVLQKAVLRVGILAAGALRGLRGPPLQRSRTNQGFYPDQRHNRRREVVKRGDWRT